MRNTTSIYLIDSRQLTELLQRHLGPKAFRCLLAMQTEAPDHSTLIELIDHVGLHEPSWAGDQATHLNETLRASIHATAAEDADQLVDLAKRLRADAAAATDSYPHALRLQADFIDEIHDQIADDHRPTTDSTLATKRPPLRRCATSGATRWCRRERGPRGPASG